MVNKLNILVDRRPENFTVYSDRASGYLQKWTSNLMLSINLILILSVKDLMSVFLLHWLPLSMIPAYYTSIFDTQHLWTGLMTASRYMVLRSFHIKSTKKSRSSLNFCFKKIGTHIGSIKKPNQTKI